MIVRSSLDKLEKIKGFGAVQESVHFRLKEQLTLDTLSAKDLTQLKQK